MSNYSEIQRLKSLMDSIENITENLTQSLTELVSLCQAYETTLRIIANGVWTRDPDPRVEMTREDMRQIAAEALSRTS